MRIELSTSEATVLGELAANDLLLRLRKKDNIDENTLKLVNRLPWVDCVRKHVTDADLHWLGDLVLQADRREARYLGISLLQALQRITGVRDILDKLWAEATDYSSRWQIAPRLLDFEDLKVEMHRDIYNWIRLNWTQWTADATTWYGGADAVLAGVTARLNDERFPPTKAWLYLCIATTSNDKVGAHNVIATYSTSTLPFVNLVANELLRSAPTG